MSGPMAGPTDPVLTVAAVPRPPRRHALATQSGLSLMVEMLEADRVWSGCTNPQQVLLAELCPPIVEILLRERELRADQMPTVPEGTRQSMRDALARRGLVDDAGRLTGRAVHAWYWTQGMRPAGRADAVVNPGVDRD